ncbi:cytochrome c nitrite reductase small subunit [Kineosphaera limosa]|uniref:Cytochrome c-type protein n=1 Tax=Kineosphaera limosa NBRC 100340 TaxID=1184609 RepID=K6X5Z9_9MICO|nr:cytochrome c nitrite reductase small subunit [Kineosphaera limosa]NYE02798.1 cytochrome c nitrite reductase small subunit [Kineosphaera limosa]GAB94229.1 cytochrome c-type protein NrfH [Kineosphaera limosa NBRC 100340]
MTSALRGFLTAKRALAGLAVFVIGSLLGVGVFTFGYANGASYLTNDPQACINCHTMRDQYAGWMASSHGKVATCNDCHAPHDIVGKYATKATNGFFHGLAMTTGDFPDNIRIKPHNLEVTENACLYCHADITSDMRAPRVHSTTQSCVACHRNVGHL